MQYFIFLFVKVREIDENTITQLKKMIPVEVGKQVRKFREKKKLSQTELAERIGKDRQYLYKIETGKVSSSIFTLAVIALALDISLSELMHEIKY
ncbi:helix-turn-helix domain-containing protein [Chryseobacterium rhizosphaerae]|uniref:helix-turn-helix domain-containing protein n=1 Tax=Chryseobacterium rhizosphaerae TaxID=395937 RepID=UPI00235A2803|nr:helix-turn-helix transcriptional regulator [Chryseobacterium rhizosphaerae]MDC8099422.1 helix-turn-helix domain-containing protein [Chryseobacterium rhizosphaerae]